MTKYLITGGAGYIGSSVADRLLKDEKNEVIAFDNFSTGRREFIQDALKNPRYKLIVGDLLDTEAIDKAMEDIDFVFHFAANADIRRGCEHPRKDLEQNTIATFNVLDAMRRNKAREIVFSSTGPIYGEAQVIPTPEDAPLPIQTSLYGASKLACEGLIEAFCEGFGFTSYIFRFVSILGERYQHGHVYDFYEKLLKDPSKLYILGNGKQRKSYLYIQDCIDAIFTAVEHKENKVNIYNLGTPEYCEVTDSARWISEEMGLNPKFEFSGGDRGWVGDNPFIFLDTTKIQSLGWKPKLTIKEAVIQTVKYLKENEWLFEERK